MCGLALPIATSAQSITSRAAVAEPAIGRALINGVNGYHEVHGIGKRFVYIIAATRHAAGCATDDDVRVPDVVEIR